MITRIHDNDDDGTRTTGTVHNDAWLQAIFDILDARWSENTTTATGNQDNFDYSEADYLRCNNATTITLRGLKAPASPAKPGKTLAIFSIGAGTVVLNDQDTNSTAANRLITGTAAAVTLTAGTGWAVVQYDATTARWRVRGSSASAGGGAAPVGETTTSTGTQNDFAPSGITFVAGQVTTLRCNNATLLTINGFAAGVDGAFLEIVSVGAGQVDFANQAAGSTAANRLINNVTATRSLAPGVGVAQYVYDGTTARWRCTAHSQGAWIDYSGTSTIVGWTTFTTKNLNYYLTFDGELRLGFWIQGTSNATTTTFTAPYAAASGINIMSTGVLGQDNGTNALARGDVTSGSATITFYKDFAGTAWTASGSKIVAGHVAYQL